MPAKNKRQQRLFGMALALERGKMSKSKASKKVKEISKGMTEKKIKEFAKTKHKGLTENMALSFKDFLNEDAYVTPEGELKDLEFTPEEEYEINSYDNISSLADFLEDSGARDVTHRVAGEQLMFMFDYATEPYRLQLDLDNDKALLIKTDIDDGVPRHHFIYSGPTDGLFDLIKVNGFSFLSGY